jgi:predicted nucleic acid-binding protein
VAPRALGAHAIAVVAPARLAASGVSAGATYDGLIALAALEHDLELFTSDKRAERTYRALDVRDQLLG